MKLNEENFEKVLKDVDKKKGSKTDVATAEETYTTQVEFKRLLSKLKGLKK